MRTSGRGTLKCQDPVLDRYEEQEGGQGGWGRKNKSESLRVRERGILPWRGLVDQVKE
jgi:hypothetical protein